MRARSYESAPVTAAGVTMTTAGEFGRTKDVERIFGLKRGSLYNLMRDGKIRGKLLRIRGDITGVRLWDLDSIRTLINSAPDESSSSDSHCNN